MFISSCSNVIYQNYEDFQDGKTTTDGLDISPSSHSNVNYFLWHAAKNLQPIDQIAKAIPQKGMIVTKWYAYEHDYHSYRRRVIYHIKGPHLRAHAIRVFIEVERKPKNASSHDDFVPTQDNTATIAKKIEEAVLADALRRQRSYYK